MDPILVTLVLAAMLTAELASLRSNLARLLGVVARREPPRTSVCAPNVLSNRGKSPSAPVPLYADQRCRFPERRRNRTPRFGATKLYGEIR